jgi:hypothetical protein
MNIRLIVRFLSAVLFFLTIEQATAAEIFCKSTLESNWEEISDENKRFLSQDMCKVAIFAGTILEGDAAKVQAFLIANAVVYLHLDSRGGNLMESMSIGRLVRSNNLITFVGARNDKHVCASSCFFIWVAGIYRSGFPLIHRPYLEDGAVASEGIGA